MASSTAATPHASFLHPDFPKPAHMPLRPLGTSGLKVSLIGLGTMTWGDQNTETEAHAQMDYALDAGINFWDAAEMYPVPPNAETCGRTEQYIGSWLKSRQFRDKIILASKVAGPSGMTWIREGKARFDRQNMMAALEGSLKRLQTDVIDLYQLHWPQRHTNYFGQLGYTHNPNEDFIPLAETLAVLADAQQAGKIRHIGVSNETPWGVMQYLKLAETQGLPRIHSIQNPYSLLNRSFEVGLAEIAMREQCGLLAYSPMAFGWLSGKYHTPTLSDEAKNGRVQRWESFNRYSNPEAYAATQAYLDLANELGVRPAQLALAYVNTRPFVTSNLIGATSMDQLAENIASISLGISPEVNARLEAIHKQYPYPAP